MSMPIINHVTPAHYTFQIQPVEVAEAWGLNFNLGNVVKYVCRAGLKPSITNPANPILEDREKAAFYLNREIERRK